MKRITCFLAALFVLSVISAFVWASPLYAGDLKGIDFTENPQQQVEISLDNSREASKINNMYYNDFMDRKANQDRIIKEAITRPMREVSPMVISGPAPVIDERVSSVVNYVMKPINLIDFDKTVHEENDKMIRAYKYTNEMSNTELFKSLPENIKESMLLFCYPNQQKCFIDYRVYKIARFSVSSGLTLTEIKNDYPLIPDIYYKLAWYVLKKSGLDVPPPV